MPSNNRTPEETLKIKIEEATAKVKKSRSNIEKAKAETELDALLKEEEEMSVKGVYFLTPG